MKRIIEKGNLAFNHMNNICDLCKRCKGFRAKNDNEYDCKYNTNGKGLYSGLTKDHMKNYKCKYFKRHQKYFTCRLQSKSYKIYRNGKTECVIYKRGKFIISKI